VLGAWFKVFDDPEKRLASLKRAVRNRILRKAVRAGSKITIAAARKDSPKVSGALKASIGVRVAVHKRTKAVYAAIGPRRRFQFKRKGKVQSVGAPTKIAHLVLGGVRAHSLKKGDTLTRLRVNKRTGRLVVTQARQSGHMHPGAKANNFLRRAQDETAAAVLAKMREVIAAELANLKPGEGDAG
jgi:hypothetical protein